MPQVASDLAVQRPPRPEQASGRAAATPSSGSFEGLLDGAPAATRRARPDRTTRPRPSERADQPSRANDQPRPESRRDRDPAKPAQKASDPNTTKPAATPNTRQGKSGDSSDSAAPAATTASANADAVAPIPDLAVIAQAVTVKTTGDATAEAVTSDTAATPDKAEGDDTAPAVTADTKAADIAAVIVAVAAPAPAPAAAPSTGAATTAIDADAAASASAPAAATNPATPEAPPAQGAPPAGQDAATAPTGPKAPIAPAIAAATADAAPTDAAALKAAGLNETSDNKSPAPADRKSEPGKTKSESHSGIAPTDTRAPADAAKAPTDAPEQAKSPVLHQQTAQVAEHSATARAAPAEGRADAATAPAPAQPASVTPNLPFALTLAGVTPHALAPAVALRVDATADNAVPVAGIAVEIVSRANEGSKRFDIRLDPPELGRIDVRLDVDTNGKVTSRLIVERSETLDLLKRDAPQLERALQHAGLSTEGGLEFSLRDQSFAQREQAPRELPTTHLIVPDEEPIAAETARRGYGRMIGLGGGVDIKV